MPFNAPLLFIRRIQWWREGMLHRLANGNSRLSFHSIVAHENRKEKKTFLIIIIIITFTFNPEAIKQPRRRNPINCFLNFSFSLPLVPRKNTTTIHGKGEGEIINKKCEKAAAKMYEILSIIEWGTKHHPACQSEE